MDITNNDEDYYESNFSNLFSPSSTSPPPSTQAPEDDIPSGTHLYRARLILENHLYDELLNRYKLAVTRLRDFTTEANALQEENEWLRLANDDLTRRLTALLMSPPEHNESAVVVGSGGGEIGVSDHYDRHNYNTSNNNIIVGSNSPTSVINDGEERFSLPKIISVRSPGYFKLMSDAPPPPTIPRPPIPESNRSTRPPPQDVKGTKLRVRGDDEVRALEMEVYNQGMFKTELCNKWQETGTCPYGEQCRFAHGVSELRPVIRHPRYKTQVCRMVVAGVRCPYGHRCHFRHALSPTRRLS